MPKFQVGDKVVSKRSGKIAEVVRQFTYCYEPWYEVQFLESKVRSETKELNLIPYTEQPSSTTNTMQDSNALYSFTKTDGSTGYATYLATNSAGEWVVEERGTGTIHTLPKDNFEEVVEYTIKVRSFLSGDEYHFKGIKEGSVEVNDIIVTTYNLLYRVIKLNSKSKTAETFKGIKLLTESL